MDYSLENLDAAGNPSVIFRHTLAIDDEIPIFADDADWLASYLQPSV